jgi:hypothetical protein
MKRWLTPTLELPLGFVQQSAKTSIAPMRRLLRLAKPSDCAKTYPSKTKIW